MSEGPTLDRRQVLGLGAAAVASTVLAPWGPGEAGATTAQTSTDGLRPAIRPRADWAGDLPVTGEIEPEDDVRFLLVHHTASTNDYGPDEVVDQIRGFYDFHTGPEKGWPDVAYNFFIDRYGGIWEARAGSLAGPVRGDATGGSQGFALLCSLIGNHLEEPMTPEATDALVALLAWLGATYGVDTNPGANVQFTSRGSSRWPVGAEVTAATISGHRDMSTTTCPGDFVYDLLETDIPTLVSARRAEVVGPDPTTSTSTTSSTSTSASSSTTTATTTPSTTAAPASPDVAAGDLGNGDDRSWPLIIAGGIAGVIAAGGAAISRLRGR